VGARPYELMTPDQLRAQLSREDFLRELHHLLRVEPHFNNGLYDEGWNCRDHALIVAGIVHMLGLTGSMLFGRAAFVQGPHADAPPVARDVQTHAWVGVDRAGVFDLSVQLAPHKRYPGWVDWGVRGLFGHGFLPAGRVDIVMPRHEAEFENCLAAATHRANRRTAIYLGVEYTDLRAQHVANGLAVCNSPLTDRLRGAFGERGDLHARAIVHLCGLLRGEAATLANVGSMDAWAVLAERQGNAVFRVCARGKLS
jgi:hypothetical protein